MRQARRKLPQTGQSVALLLEARGFANPVGHQAHQPLGQFRHLLHQLREIARKEIAAMRPSVTARPVTPILFIRENGSSSADIARHAAES